MPMLGAIAVPHPPVLLPEVGRGREQQIDATAQAMREAARTAADWNPDVLIVSSPHTIWLEEGSPVLPLSFIFYRARSFLSDIATS